jgi:hypothetical protein
MPSGNTANTHWLPDPLADLKGDTVVYTPMSDPSFDNATDVSFNPAQARALI